MTQRKVIHTSATSEESIVATCDDGTLWLFALHNWPAGWQQLPPIPQPEPKEEFNINVNGRNVRVVGTEISYSTICALAEYSDQYSYPSVMYSDRHNHIGGTLLPSKIVKLSEGMIFNVVHTNNA